MRYALVDNATLTAVQRLLGDIPIKNKYIIDSDILALENLIQAILLYDKVVVLDDYKEQYRTSRKETFGWIQHYKPSPEAYRNLISTAKEITEGIVPRVEGGTLKDSDFKPFFDLLGMNIIFTWDISSSVYYLTQKILEDVGGLDIEKYSKLSTMIYDNVFEKYRASDTTASEKIVLVDSKGKPISSTYKVVDADGILQEAHLSSQVETFFAALNWLSMRTVTYTLLAKELGIDLFLHHIRDAFQVNFLSKLNVGNQSIFRPVLELMKGQSFQTLSKITEPIGPLELVHHQLPMFTVWLADRTKDPHKFIETAFSIRDEKMFVEARQKLIEYEELLNQDDVEKYIKELNNLRRDIQKHMDRVCVKYGVETPQGVPLTGLIHVANAFLAAKGLPKLPVLRLNIKQLDFLRDLKPRKGFAAVYRSVVDDLAKIGRFGRYYEIIASKTRYSKDANYLRSKTEKPQYAKRKSWWKLPM